MVKKVTRNNAGVNSSQVGLGYVLNEELLDEILGEYDHNPNGKGGKGKRGVGNCAQPVMKKVPQPTKAVSPPTV